MDYLKNVDIDSIPRLTAELEAKAQRLRNEGVSVPHTLAYELAKPIPSAQIQAWSWWPFFFDRPSRRTAPDAQEWDIQNAQKAWDTQQPFVANSVARMDERARQAAEAQRQREAEDAALRASEASQIKAELRARFLRLPGTTEQEFEREFPTLLSDQRRRELNTADTSMQRDVQRMGRIF